MKSLEVFLATPRGFCAGVERAIEIVHRALDKYGCPIYVKHEVVHNRKVVEDLKARGVIFVNNVDEIPEHSIVVFSAHGVSQRVRRQAAARFLNVLDATCPLVTKVHHEVVQLHQQGYTIIMIGHRNHVEVEGTMGQIDDTIHFVESIADVDTLELTGCEKIAYVTQTTLSLLDTDHIIRALKKNFPHILSPNKKDICYATENRQVAVANLSRQVDLVIVVGSQNSSNSNRLRELATSHGVPAYLVDSVAELDEKWFVSIKRVGLTAGASAPETLVQDIVAYLRQQGAHAIFSVGDVTENIHFSLPRSLSQPSTDLARN